MKLPGATRWGSVIFCIESLFENRKALKTLAISDDLPAVLNKDVSTNVLPEDFWCGLKIMHQFFSPIVKWITLLESDSIRLSSVVTAFLEIQNSFEELLKDSALFC